jgi:uncharacterized protein
LTLWRFPVKSLLGERLDAVDVADGGTVGDRAYAIRDKETGKIASAWSRLAPLAIFRLC